MRAPDGVHRRIPTAGETGSISHTPLDLIRDAFASGVLGGSAVALFFLLVDLLDGQPLFTPSLLGSMLFQGAEGGDLATVQLDVVAYFSIVHMLVFAALGGAISLLVHEVELHSRHPVVVLFVVFAILEAGFFFAAPAALPGVIASLGIARVGVANLLAAGTMALYFVLAHRAKPWHKLEHTRGELILDSLYSGLLGGAAVALFFLFVDLLDGRPLFTPSLIGSVIFHGVAAGDVATLQLDAAAYYSIVHIAVFAALGGAASFLVHEVELHSRHPVVVLLVLFAILEVGIVTVAPLALPGVVEELGVGRVGVANLLAAATMASFFVLAHRAGAWEKVRHTTPDLIFDSVYSGAIGGSAVALFFMVADLLDGQPLFTPSLMGSVLFHGVEAEAVADVNLDAVAYFSIVHMLMFAVVGTAISWLVHEVELHSRHPFEVLIALFAVLEVGFFSVASLALPGVIAKLGVARVAFANLLAAGSIAVFFVLSHRAEAWQELKHAVHLDSKADPR